MRGSPIRRLARLYGVSTSYIDVWHTRRKVSDEALLLTLEQLGAPIRSAADAPEAIAGRRRELWRELLAPVSVAWEGTPAAVTVRATESQANDRWQCRLEWEAGGYTDLHGTVDAMALGGRRVVDGTKFEVRRLPLPADLPRGYHRLNLEFGGRQHESLLVVAPIRTYGDTPDERHRSWGVFLPLYALHRDSSAAAGDFSDLEALMEWTSQQGGSLVATLPLLATLWELTDDPSPYNPASRLFSNEFYLDLRQIAEFAESPEAQALLSASESRQGPGADSPADRLIDYPRQMRHKRRILEAMCRRLFEGPAARRRDALMAYCKKHPEVEAFARFRAVGERQKKAWPEWPEPMRSGTITAADFDETTYRYHLYTQWQVDEQLQAMSDRARQRNMLWYLDYPLGVSGAGYDVWREPDLFVRKASSGAPPDAFFTKGQDWGFPPLQPAALRRQGYRYFIQALRNHLRHARILRLDHVMGLYRSYWIPHGLQAGDGAYVRYPLDEFLAILSLESHRYRARIVGENLGTVPAQVDEALERHGIGGMYVLQYETNPDKHSTLRPIPAAVVASINTHDMPMFAAYWQGLDIDDRRELGLLTPHEAASELARRERLRNDLVALLQGEGLLESSTLPSTADVLRACEALLARSPADLVLVSLEDLWGETEPQNVPGTYHERPNWRRKARQTFESFRDLPEVLRILSEVHRLRNGPPVGLHRVRG